MISGRALGIVIVLAVLGLARSRQACAQGYTPEDIFYIDIANLTDGEITDICIRAGKTTSAEFHDCFDSYVDLRATAQQRLIERFQGQRFGLPGRIGFEASGSSSSTFAPTLVSSTPALPFLGNWLTVLSWVPNSTTLSDAKVAYAVGLTRAPDCGLSYLGQPLLISDQTIQRGFHHPPLAQVQGVRAGLR